MSCVSVEARAVLAGFPALVAGLSFVDADESELKAVLVEVRAAQRCLDGIVMRIGVRSNRLAAVGKSAPAEETARGGGAVGARQARREAARARAAEDVAGLEDAVTAGDVSGEHVDSIARHAKKLTPEQRAAFDFESLIAEAVGLPPETFDRLVKRRVEEVVADHGLADTKAKQAASEFRHWFDHDSGMGRFTGALDPERYELLVNAVDHHTTALAARDGVAKTKHLAAQALVELVTGGSQPKGRGRVPSILVVVDNETIRNGPHPGSVCQTEQGNDIATESVARLCCDAVVRRVTLDDRGVPLNVGRKHRTATDGQWAALKTMYTSCAWDGCAAPINWCLPFGSASLSKFRLRRNLSERSEPTTSYRSVPDTTTGSTKEAGTSNSSPTETSRSTNQTAATTPPSKHHKDADEMLMRYQRPASM